MASLRSQSWLEPRSWFLVHVLMTLHINGCVWPLNSTDLPAKPAYNQKLTSKNYAEERLGNHIIDKYQG